VTDPELATGLVLLGAAGKQVLSWGERVTGPVLDQIGQDLKDGYVSHRREAAVRRTLRKMQKKLGDRSREPGEVPARVVKVALDDGSWCDSEIMSEYFAGILAASRSPDGRSDRGASWAALVSGLASYDVYMHYLVYDAFRRLYLGDDLLLGMGDVHQTMAVYLPVSGLVDGLGLTGDGPDEIVQSLSALAREGLIGEPHRSGPRDFVAQEAKEAPEAGAVLRPSSYGIELFLWAHGYSTLPRTALLDPDLEFDTEEAFGFIAGARKVVDMQREHNKVGREQAESTNAGRSRAR
jgi:hypothetical protein